MTDRALVSRRTLLKSGGAVLATGLLHLNAPSGFAKSTPIETGSAQILRVGLGLPHNAVLRSEFLAGLQASGTVRVTLSDVADLTQLATQDGYDVLVALAHRERIFQLQHVLSERLVVVPTLQSAVPRSSDQAGWLFGHSFPVWGAAWATGQWAATQHASAVILHSFRESGYDTAYALYCGYVAAGGTVQANITTMTPQDIAAALDRALELDVRLLCINYSGADLHTFAELWADHPLRKRAMLVGAPGTLFDLQAVAAQILGPIHVCTSWVYGTTAPTKQSAWTMLGQDTAYLLHAAGRQIKDWADRSAVIRALQQVQASGKLRGYADTLQAAPATWTICHFQVRRNRWIATQRSTLQAHPTSDQALVEHAHALRTGFLHEYGTI